MTNGPDTERLIAELRAASPNAKAPNLNGLIKLMAECPDLNKEKANLEVLASTAVDADAFRVYYCLFYIARRQKCYGDMRRLAQQMQRFTSEVPVVLVLLADALAAGQTHLGGLKHAYQAANEALKANADLSGAYVSHCSIALALFDATSAPSERARYLAAAERSIDRALDLNPEYAKSLALKARAAALRQDFDEAMELINRAIDAEPSSRADYAIRISDYQVIKMEIGYRRNSEELRREQHKALEEVSLAREQVIQILGLLAAVIAFLTTGITIALKLPTTREAARLVIIVGGVILTVFSGFGVSFGLPGKARYGIGFAAGLALMVIPLVYFPSVN